MVSGPERSEIEHAPEAASRNRVALDADLVGDARFAEFDAELPHALRLAAAPGRIAADATFAPEDGFFLTHVDGRLELRPPGEHGRAGIRADFPPDAGASARDPLARAFGRRVDRIVDATAGLGADAYRLARAGYDVVAIERHPIVFALSADGWRGARERRAVPDAVFARLEFVFGEASRWLARRADEGRGLGVFVDPMYPPPRRASARPRRALQVLRALLEDDGDAAAVVAQARERAARVVVKRPHHAMPLLPDVSHTIESKLVRFDVYVHPERLLEAPR